MDILEILFRILRTCVKDILRKKGKIQSPSKICTLGEGYTAHGIYLPEKCYLHCADESAGHERASDD